LGQHVAQYMRELEESNSEAYQRQFSRYIAANITADDIEEIYVKAHAAIRADPTTKKVERSPESTKELAATSKRFKRTKMNLKQRRNRINQKKAAFLATQIAS
jgi:large subunit ribosomal protein L5e